METKEYPDKESARRAFVGAQQTAANQFFRAATSKSRDFKSTELGGNRHRLEFFSPARTGGFGKRYVQVIGPDGAVVLEYKETQGPQGLIETKWVHNSAEVENEHVP